MFITLIQSVQHWGNSAKLVAGVAQLENDCLILHIISTNASVVLKA